jgi:hypothetical protein
VQTPVQKDRRRKWKRKREGKIGLSLSSCGIGHAGTFWDKEASSDIDLG